LSADQKLTEYKAALYKDVATIIEIINRVEQRQNRIQKILTGEKQA
jgi:hypothetical protein